MRDDYAFRHEVSAEELCLDYQPTEEDIALASQIESFTLTAWTGPLSDEPTERAAQIRQGKIDMYADRRMARNLRLGRPPRASSRKCKPEDRIDGFTV
jgi:hypothetical protein